MIYVAGAVGLFLWAAIGFAVERVIREEWIFRWRLGWHAAAVVVMLFLTVLV